MSVNAVTDTATFTLDTFIETDGDAIDDIFYESSTQTITVTDNTIFKIPLRLSADDMLSESSNGQDLDSETIISGIEISGVPKGIIVVGGTYLGDTESGNTGLWRVNITDDLSIDSLTGEINNISFEVGESTYADIHQDITIAIKHHDASGSTLTNTQTFTLILDGTTFGVAGTGTGGGTNTDPMDVTLSVNSVNLVEDTSSALGDLVSIGDALSLGDTSQFAITLTNLSACSVSGMELVNGFYTYQGSGTAADLQNYIENNIFITPNLNNNVNTPANVAFDMTITTYGSNSSNTYTSTVNSEVAPVSDATTISIVGDGAHASEDSDGGNYETITIDLNNLADAGRVIIVGNSVSIQLSETVIDGAVGGIVKDSSGNTLAVDGITWNTFALNDVDTNIVLKYYPQANLYGSLDVTAKVQTQEDPLLSGYTTSPVETVTTQTITIAPVNDSISPFAPTVIGNEDEIVLLNFGGAVLADATESITGATLSGIPFGYDVYLNGVKVNGSISGKDGNGDYIYSYNFSSVTSIADLETIGVKKSYISDFSGTINGVTLSVVSGEAGSQSTQTYNNLTVTFNPVADVLLSMSATKTFGAEYTWVNLNINANVKDTDASETLRVILSGAGTPLNDTMLFQLSDGSAVTSSFSAGVWTLSDIAYTDINDIQLLYGTYNDTVNVVVKTVDGSSVLSDADDSQSSFNLNLATSTNITTGDENNVITTSNAGVTVNAGDGDDTVTGGTGNDTLNGEAGADTINAGAGNDTIITDGLDTIDGGLGIDTLILEVGITLDFTKLENIEIIDLTLNANHALNGMTLNDVVQMTDANNTLTINADVGDSVTLSGGVYDAATNPDGWLNTGSNAGYTTYTSTDGIDSVSLKIEDSITPTIS